MGHKTTFKKKSSGDVKTTPAESQNENMSDDDRNLKAVDASIENVQFDERVWLLWNQKKSSVKFMILVVMGALAVYLIAQKAEQAKLESLQLAYVESLSGNMDDFIAKHGDTTLGGLALITQADEKFKAKDYKTAAEKYNLARTALAGNLLSARAGVGFAIASIYAGDVDAGKKTLNSVLQDKDALESQKIEATYHLAILEIGQKNFEEAKKHVKAIESNEKAGSWSQKIALTKKNYPELADAEVVAPATTETAENASVTAK